MTQSGIVWLSGALPGRESCTSNLISRGSRHRIPASSHCYDVSGTNIPLQGHRSSLQAWLVPMVILAAAMVEQTSNIRTKGSCRSDASVWGGVRSLWGFGRYNKCITRFDEAWWMMPPNFFAEWNEPGVELVVSIEESQPTNWSAACRCNSPNRLSSSTRTTTAHGSNPFSTSSSGTPNPIYQDSLTIIQLQLLFNDAIVHLLIGLAQHSNIHLLSAPRQSDSSLVIAELEFAPQPNPQKIRAVSGVCVLTTAGWSDRITL